VLHEELRAEVEQRLLDALVAPRVGELEYVVEDRRGAGHEDAPLVQQQPLADAPGVTVVSGGHGVAMSAQGGVGVHLPAQVVEEPEGRH
jgi:hypothetical protein